VRVIKDCEHGIVRPVTLLDDTGREVVPVTRFLSHLADSNYSPNTVCGYAYDLRHLAVFLDERALGWNDFLPSTALEFLAYLRRVPSRRPAQRLGLTVATEQGRLLSAATVQRVLAATSSFFEWAIAAEQYTAGENPMQRPGRSRAGPGAGSASAVRRRGEPATARTPYRAGAAPAATATADDGRGCRRATGQPHDSARSSDFLVDARWRAASRGGALFAAG
jgi:Phage integrase, N-terminal SAM-like domain